MADEKKPDIKKTFPNSFIFFLLAAVLIIMMVQNFIDTKQANVSFSYQLEHLVNLQLIQPEDSRKTALNDHLVSFSGKFRMQVPEEGKKRYKYLESLNSHHALIEEKGEIEEELKTFRSKITNAADMFLHLRGLPLPAVGYRVVENVYDTPERVNSIVIRELSDKDIEGIASLERRYNEAVAKDDAQEVEALGRNLAIFVQNMRSPLLGIGNETMKQQLKGLETSLTEVDVPDKDPQQKLVVYGNVLQQLRGIINDLDVSVDHVRLSKLRSVRNYKEALERHNLLIVDIDDNEMALDKARRDVARMIWFFNNQELSTRVLEQQDVDQYHQWFANAKKEWENFPSNKGFAFKAPDQPLNTVLEKKFKSEPPPSNYFGYLFNLLPVLLVVLLLYFIFSRQMRGMGSSAMNFGKSPAKLLQKGEHKVTFKDVAGLDEAVEELQEIVEFLKSPQKFTALGGRIPKGVLCIGPPGTGKTLIARAVAGEADRPFFSISGSDFVEMFVGVGASRIRDMFDQAKKNAPCIIFMDEIDAVGRHRGAGIGGGHDEREQTLNQLLVEMDGFDPNEGVILMAATNRPDVLDKALLRPGRFDRRVVLGLPDIKGRFEILKVHARKIKLDESVDLMTLARSSPGLAGADLENILNESALLAARKGRTAVTEVEIMEARDKVIYGKERRSLEIDENEKKTTAYHESGHAIVGLNVDHADPIDKVTIIPRGMSLGATMFLPKKNRTNYWKKELLDQLAVLMGGRCAEEIFVGDISSGAQNDIERASQLARSMVCEWGMSDKLGMIAYEERAEAGQYLGLQQHHEKRYSETTAKIIDEEVRHIIEEAYGRAMKIIKKYSKQLELMAEMLMEFETLDTNDVQKILKDEWNAEEKRERLKAAEERHKKEIKQQKSQEEEKSQEEDKEQLTDETVSDQPFSL